MSTPITTQLPVQLTFPENNTVILSFAVSLGGLAQNISGWSAFQFSVYDLKGVLFLSKTLGSGIAVTNGPAGQGTITINPTDTAGHPTQALPQPVGYNFEFKGTDAGGSVWTLRGPGGVNITPTLI